MEIKKEVNIEKLVGIKKQKQFKITSQSLQMIFHALINMYSDPIGSIVRELTSNCLDAHTERELKRTGKLPLGPGEDAKFFSNNTNVQIEYIQQNKILGIDEAIIFRDFGMGLSEQRVEEVYTVFGESTKSVNNDQIGGFGLGCKSPFTYTDTFYITTSYNGTLYYYMLSKTNEGLSMDLMHEEESNTKNYSEIVIPINTRDERNQFVEAIQEQLIYIRNIEYINIPDLTIPKIVFEDEHVVITKERMDGYSILIGPIRYPLNTGSSDFHYMFSNYITTNHTITFKFPIGVLELVPSRESVIYSPRTISAIKDKMKVIETYYTDLFQETLSHIEKDDLITQIKYARGFEAQKEEMFKDESLAFYLLSKVLAKNTFESIAEKICSYKGADIVKAFSELSITRYAKTYPRRSRIADVTAYTMSLNELLEAPNRNSGYFYSERDTLSSLTNRSIINDSARNFNNFYVYKKKKSKEWLSELSPLALKLHNSLETHLHEFFTEDYDKCIVKKTKKVEEERITIKELIRNDSYNFGRNLDNVSFIMNSAFPEEIERIIDGRQIIYGFSEDDHLLRIIGLSLLFTNSDYYVDESNTGRHSKRWVVVKIAKDLEDYFTDGIYVKELIKMKHQLLRTWYTTELIRERLKGMEYFKRFDKFFPVVQNLYNQLNSIIEKQTYVPGNLSGPIRELCEEYDLADKAVLKKLEFLERYHQGIGFLANFHYFYHTSPLGYKVSNDELEKEIRLILQSKGKRITVESKIPFIPKAEEELKEVEAEVEII